MKKIIIALLVLVMFMPIRIYSEDDVIHLDTSLIDPGLSLNDYAIYHEGDLTLSIDIDTNIEDTNGIYVDGNLVVVGEHTLNIDVTGIGINVTGTLTVLNPLINISGQTNAYIGSQIEDRAYVIDSSGNMAYFFEDSYYDYDLENILTSITIKPKEYADISKIDKSHTTLYKKIGDDVLSYPSVEGFIINENVDESSVSYNEDLLTYYVNIWKDFDENNKTTNFIEFIFDKSEWGKTLDYEVIEAKNFYEDYDLDYEYVKDDIRHSMSLVGYDRYSYLEDASSIDAVSDFMLFVTNSTDNKIVLKIYGKDDEYRYINLIVNEVNKEEEEEEKQEVHEEKEYYHVVNTDAVKDLPSKPEDLSGAYRLNSDIKTSGNFKVTGETSIDLNGHKITCSNKNPLFIVNNNLTINGEKENSSIELGSKSSLVDINDNYTININGGTFKSSSSKPLLNINKGTLNISNANLASNSTDTILFAGDNLSIVDTSINSKADGIVISDTEAKTRLKNIDIVSAGQVINSKGTIIVESGIYSFDPSDYTDDKYVIGINQEGKYIVGYSVLFNLDNDSDNKTVYVIENEKVNKIDDPIKEGYEFVTWLLNGTEYDFDTPITESIDLIAKYDIKAAKINDTYYSDLNSALLDSKEEDTIILLKDISDIDVIDLKPNVTLDLNGHKLSVNSFNSWGLVKDTLESGKLIILKDNFYYFNELELSPSEENVLPIYDEDGYVFSSLSYIGQEWKYGLNDEYHPKYRFQPHANDINKILKNTSDSDIGVFVEIEYKKEVVDENKIVEFSDAYLKEFLKNPLNTVMYVSLLGTEDIDNIKARSFLKSKSSNLTISSNYIETTREDY